MALTGYNSLVTSLLPPQPLLKASFTGQAAGQLHSSLYLAGLPGAASAPSPGVNGATLTSYAGQIPFPATSGSTTIYLAGMDATQAANVGGVMLCDRLWHNSGLTVTTTTAQSITFSGLPARDSNGTTNGVGVMLGIEVTTTTGNAGAITNMTASYTDSGGTAANTATVTSYPAGAVAGTFVPFNLAAGDVGVRSVESVTFGTSLVSGAVSMVCYRVIAVIPTTTANLTQRQSWSTLGLPIMYNNSVPWMVYILSGTAGGQVVSNITYAQG
jgi:hypothetical protein